MDQQKLVSLIVPVYNAERYLDKCIESILKQTYKNIEIILINDGSSDSSETICLKYANNDKRVVYLKQRNSGPSVARNNGITISKGEYIQFLDADDYLPSDSVMTMVEAMYESDFVIAGYYSLVLSSHGIKKNSVTSKRNGIHSKTNILLNWGDLVEEKMFHYIWNKLYKAEFIKGKLKFDENIKISEDMIFNMDYLSLVERINIINTPIYYHVFFNQGSITKRYHSGLFEMRKKTHEYIERFLISNNVYNNKNYEIVNNLYARRIKSLLIQLASKKTNRTTRNKISIINNIISDNSVHEILGCLSNSYLGRLTAYLIRKKRARLLYGVYMFREYFFLIYFCVKERIIK